MNNDINKDILYLLNETEIDLDELDKNDFTDIESKKIKKNFRKYKICKKNPSKLSAVFLYSDYLSVSDTMYCK